MKRNEESSLNPKERPKEAQIERLLQQIKPMPGQRFHQRMAGAPWSRTEQKAGWKRLHWSTVSAVTLLFLLLISLSLFALPSFRALAQQVKLFFWNTSSDSLELTSLPSETASLYAASATPSFLLSIQEVQVLAGYLLLLPGQLPEGLHFDGASYDPALEAVTLFYSGANHTLLLMQRPIGKIQEYSTVGASASIEPVTVRGEEGEIVSGGWTIATPGPGEGTQASTSNVSWDTQLNQHILRWQESGMIYKILSSGEDYLSAQELVSFAEILK